MERRLYRAGRTLTAETIAQIGERSTDVSDIPPDKNRARDNRNFLPPIVSQISGERPTKLLAKNFFF
jgi:hypothetical protein